MSTVKTRFEVSKLQPSRGTVYYRIYRGHNRRMEFSSGIHLPVEIWDTKRQLPRTDTAQGREAMARIDRDLAVLQQIFFQFDATLTDYTIGDVIREFKRGVKVRG